MHVPGSGMKGPGVPATVSCVGSAKQLSIMDILTQTSPPSYDHPTTAPASAEEATSYGVPVNNLISNLLGTKRIQEEIKSPLNGGQVPDDRDVKPPPSGGITRDVEGLISRISQMSHTNLEQIRSSIENLSEIDLSHIYELINSNFPSIDDEQFNVILAILTLLYKMSRLRDIKELVVIAVDFINATIGAALAVRLSKVIVSSVVTVIKDFIQNLKPTTEADVRTFVENTANMHSQTTNHSSIIALRDFIVNMLMLYAYKFADLTGLSFSKDDSPEYRAKRTEAVKRRNVSDMCRNLRFYLGNNIPTEYTFPGIIDSSLRAVQHITKICSLYWYEGYSFEDILNMDSDITKWINQSYLLETDSNNTYTGLPVEGKIDSVDYYTDLCASLEEAERILARVDPKDNRINSFKHRLQVLKSIKNLKSIEHNGRDRDMPFCVMIHGQPGVGKSVLVNHVAETWSSFKGRKFKTTHMYNRQPTEDYWSGYEPKSQPIIHYSEPGSKHAKIVQSQGDRVMDEFLSVVDSLPYMCNMADLESKGKIYACPELVVIDCNDEEMNLRFLKNNPSAVRRRILYIEPTVKPEYRKNDSCEIDKDKLKLNPPVHKRDVWTFRIYERPAETLQNSGLKIIKDNVDIFEMSQQLIELFANHLDKIAAAEQANNEDIDIYLRPTPAMPVAQSDVRESSSWLYTIFVLILCYYLSKWATYLQDFFLGNWKQDIRDKVLEIRNGFELALIKVRIKKWSIYEYCLYCFYIFSLYVITYIFPESEKFLGPVKALLRFHKENVLRHIMDRPKLSINAKTFAIASVTISVIYTLYSTTSSVKKIFSEGNIITSSDKFPEETIDKSINEIEGQMNCSRPRKAVRKGNGIDWDRSCTEITVVGATDDKTLNEKTKVVRSVMRNYRKLTIFGAQEADTMALGICSNYMILNKHALVKPHSDGTWKIISTNSDSETSRRTFQITEKDFVSISQDLILMYARGELFSDIRCYLSTEHVRSRLAMRGYIGNNEVRVSNSGTTVSVDSFRGVNIIHEKTYSYTCLEHKVGFCGTPLFLNVNNSTFVAGIHCANQAGTDHCFAEGITFGQVSLAIASLEEKLEFMPILSQGELRVPVKNKGIVNKINYKHPFNFEDIPELRVFGELKKYSHVVNRKSNLQQSKMYNHVEEITEVSPTDINGEPKFVGPPMRPYWEIVDGQKLYFSPTNDFAKKVSVSKKSLNSDLMQCTINLITQHLCSNLEKEIDSLQPLLLETAVNGDPENFYMRSMKGSTSGGFSWPGAKKKYFEKVDLEYNDNSMLPLYDIKEQICEIISSYRAKKLAHPILGCQLKDEPRKNGKMTRMFSMSPVDNTIVHRMFLMPFYSLMPEFGDVFCTSIGINMHSYDVDDFCKTLHFGKDDSKYMEGDYGGYDTSMPPDVTIMTNTIVYKCLMKFGYTEEQLEIVQGLLSDNLHPTLVMDGVLFSAVGFQPSGKYATAEDNSLKGLALLCYAFITMMTPHGRGHKLHQTDRFKPEDFFKLVKPKCYGDDMLAWIDNHIIDYFNNVTYQKFCTEVYGMKFTASDKSLNISKYLKWDETSFLKRNFRFRKDLNHWVAPIERTSIMKAMAYYLPSRNEDEDVQVLQMVQSSLRELFFHLDKSEFSRVRLLAVTHYCNEYNQDLDNVLKLFPTFSEIRDSVFPNN